MVKFADIKLLDKNAKTLTQEDSRPLIRPLIWEGFNKYEIGQFPEDGGWVFGKVEIPESSDRRFVSYRGVSPENSDAMRSDPAANDKRGFYIDGQEYVSGPRSLKLDSSRWPVQAAKRISLPEKAPFGISEGTFSIIEGTGNEERNPEEQDIKKPQKTGGKPTGEREYVLRNKQLLKASSQERMTTRLKADNKATDSADSSGENTVKILSASPVGSYYIYSFDGKLLAEYNTSGQWVRDYIYMGNQLIAEYRGGPTYYYYASDQVNSTRIVMDNSGAVAYAVAYDPYGGLQKTWGTPTYTPTMKFSGKERDAESQLDYFGARYHANFYYRWLSVDPVINKDSALNNPQIWNLYAFCGNSPISYFDPDGKTEITIDVKKGMMNVDPQVEGRKPYTVPVTSGIGEGMNNPDMEDVKDIGPIKRGEWEIQAKEINDPPRPYDWIRNLLGDWGDWRVEIKPKEGTDTKGRTGQFLHPGIRPGSKGCVKIMGGKYGNKQADQVLKDIKIDPDGRIPVHVK